jgi:hypothetical protein
LAWNRDPREIQTDRRAGSAGAQSALGRKPATERVFRPALLHLADRIGTRLRAKSEERPHGDGARALRRPELGHARGDARRADLRDGDPCRGRADLARAVLADHPDEKTISLLGISVSHLEEHWDLQLELPLGLQDEARPARHPESMARWAGRPSPSIGSATASDGRESATRRSPWAFPVPSPTRSARSRKRTSDLAAIAAAGPMPLDRQPIGSLYIGN